MFQPKGGTEYLWTCVSCYMSINVENSQQTKVKHPTFTIMQLDTFSFQPHCLINAHILKLNTQRLSLSNLEDEVPGGKKTGDLSSRDSVTLGPTPSADEESCDMIKSSRTAAKQRSLFSRHPFPEVKNEPCTSSLEAFLPLAPLCELCQDGHARAILRGKKKNGRPDQWLISGISAGSADRKAWKSSCD